jgi:hypothetical protein
MYTPARSDLIAASLAATLTAALALLASQAPAVVAFAAATAIPVAPLCAAWVSGPPHSRRSRFVFRGAVAIAAMVAAVASVTLFSPGPSPGTAIAAGAGVALLFGVTAGMLLLSVEAVVRRSAKSTM